MGVPLGLLLGLLALIDGGSALVHEIVTQGGDDDQGIDGTVEAAIPARLEAVQEEHDLAHLQVTELGDDNARQLRHLGLVELFLATAIFIQVIELGQHPDGGGIVMIGMAQCQQHGSGAKEGLLHVLGTVLLHCGVHHLHERLQVRMGCQQVVDLKLQDW